MIQCRFGKVFDLLAFITESHGGDSVCNVYFQMCDTLYFDSHFNANVIEATSFCLFFDVLFLPAYPVLHSHKAFGESEVFITLKQCVHSATILLKFQAVAYYFVSVHTICGISYSNVGGGTVPSSGGV